MVVSFNEQQRITTGSKKRCSYQPLTENEESHDQQPRAPQPVDSDRGEHNAGCLTSGLISAFWQNETSRYTSATNKAPHSDSSTALFSSPSSSRELNEMKVATSTATSEARQAITVDTVAPTPTRADWRLSDQNGDSRTTNHSTASASTTRIDVKSPSSLLQSPIGQRLKKLNSSYNNKRSTGLRNDEKSQERPDDRPEPVLRSPLRLLSLPNVSLSQRTAAISFITQSQTTFTRLNCMKHDNATASISMNTSTKTPDPTIITPNTSQESSSSTDEKDQGSITSSSHQGKLHRRHHPTKLEMQQMPALFQYSKDDDCSSCGGDGDDMNDSSFVCSTSSTTGLSLYSILVRQQKQPLRRQEVNFNNDTTSKRHLVEEDRFETLDDENDCVEVIYDEPGDENRYSHLQQPVLREKTEAQDRMKDHRHGKWSFGGKLKGVKPQDVQVNNVKKNICCQGRSNNKLASDGFNAGVRKTPFKTALSPTSVVAYETIA